MCVDLRQCILITLFGSVIGAAATGFAATFGPPTGLRQISISRYAFGWWPNKVIAVLNIIMQVGFAAIACITAGLALTAVADGHLTLILGIVILACVSAIISFAGLKVVLIYERYAWLVYFIVFIIFLTETGKYTDNGTTSVAKGEVLTGSVLSFLSIMYGAAASWQAVVSDYYAHYPVDTSRWKVFFMTTFGVAGPLSFSVITGTVVSFGMNTRPEWEQVYKTQGLGFLIQTVLYPRGFAKLILTVFVLSGISVNVISLYSGAISCQQFSRPCSRVPRFIWVLLCFAAILGLSIGGRRQLSVYLQNFLSLLGYWCTQYFVILCSEHVIFRRMNFANYDLDGWNDPNRLPVGIAATAAFGIGVIAWVMGMVQTWYVGPIGKKIGLGGDVAPEFTFVVTGLVFIPARYLEKRIIGR
ncbi:Permease cytosine purine uracil thiamine allantoin [Pyrenophora seminiperda CCB06]|uniref:Permease cytosine purine uracil thiamine allantoin n=1 Tax=Pyrenophora seminiperda CCB06 TaxID=1302712 RepID=A0A3M7MBD9_9PLEO|nr:Permease cytosine purine uracil thiamine allantoin [Pyrenophora seminiperda CCB06]